LTPSRIWRAHERRWVRLALVVARVLLDDGDHKRALRRAACPIMQPCSVGFLFHSAAMKQTPWNLRCPALVAATISLVGCGVDPNEFNARPTSGVHQPITAGEPADADTAAVLVVATAGAQTGFCSGVVVSPYAVLTAAGEVVGAVRRLYELVVE
jgi:hypothetical protein